MDTATERLSAFNFSFEDITLIHFLVDLNDLYQQVVDTLLLASDVEELSVDKVFREIKSYDQRLSRERI